MSAYTIGLYEKAMPKELTWKEKLKAAKEAGYDFVEIMHLEGALLSVGTRTWDLSTKV